MEFALVAPILLMLFGGIVDFGLVMSSKSQLANGIAQGAQFALLRGPGVTTALVKGVVQSGAARAGLAATVTATVTGPACFCVSGQPVALVNPSTALSTTLKCAGTCPGTGVAPGTYVVISASYVYQPLMPLYSRLATTTISDSITVRLQ
ncbi:MAG: TadE/TadG family type IV pilus assembly protein [Acetobacteraceae bacterium]